ncbi:hypothetical protein CRE_10511 [Caenorhabditis remanei]|uniref:F-box domain-containing protein n=1 Tax=Caenorhabditis remanei TaxID=31234 RepID=E3N0N2_CAERE|nr:hypothetical protein CRE_10511 [Caenorhabditis remanei]
MTTVFPLLRLPYLVLMPVLEQMEIMERIGLSLLSKRARIFVKLLKMNCKHIDLILTSNRIVMEVFFDNSKELRVLMYTDKCQRINFIYPDIMSISWFPGSLLPVGYAFSIMDVMHCKSINQFIVAEISEHDCIPIVAKLPKIDEIVIGHIWCSNSLSYKALFQKEKRLLEVLRTVLSVSSAVTISYRFQNRNHFREIFEGNFDAVILKYFGNQITLNDLWITNAKVLELHRVNLNVRDLNRYFKLWMKKICNDRLEYLEIRIYGRTSVDLIMDGLDAVSVPIETKREFRVLGNLKKFVPTEPYEKINWEFDITRVDGRTATIRISNYETVCFYVWPESTKNTRNIEPNQSSRISTFYNSCVHHFEQLFLYFLLASEYFFISFSTSFNWNQDYDMTTASENLNDFCFHYAFFSRIALSLLSKRARMYVKLLKMKCEHINLKWNSDRIDMIVFCDFTRVLEVNMYIDEYQRSTFKNQYEGVYSWRDSSLLPVDYVLSIMDVMDCKSINKFIIVGISEHDCLPIIAKLPKIDEVVVEHQWSDITSYEAYFQKERQLLKVLRTVLPVSSAVTITYRFQNQNHLREILNGHFDAVILKRSDNWITLNDLWITNAKILEIHTAKVDVRDLNRYFKFWMKKICNDRLEYLEVRICDKPSMDLLLDGLNAISVPIETQREFRVLGNVKRFVPGRFENDRITFEFDITRADGRTATIRISNYGNVIFYVWPESTNLVPNLVPNQTSFISTFYNSCVHHFERLFLCFIVSCESFFFFFFTNFNGRRYCDVLFICLSFLIVFLSCCFLYLLL